jgi:hypothetical protein
MAIIKLFERGPVVGDAVYIEGSGAGNYPIRFYRYSDVVSGNVPSGYEFVGVIFNVSRGVAKILHKDAVSLKYALDSYDDGMATSDWYRRKNGGTTNYRGILNVARGVAYWATNGSTPSANIPVQYSGNDIINSNSFYNSEYCEDLRKKYANYEAYIRDNMMVMLPQHEGCFSLPDSKTLQATYGDQMSGSDYKYPAFHYCKNLYFYPTQLSQGQWFLPNVWDGAELMRDDVLAKVAATMTACGGSAPNNSTHRWFAQRYNRGYAWFFYGDHGDLNDGNVTDALAVQAVALLEF